MSPLSYALSCSYLPFSRHSFRMVPFLTELRAVMDWVWTDTTLSLSSWICLEDIYANIFILRCWRESEKVEQICSWFSRTQMFNITPFSQVERFILNVRIEANHDGSLCQININFKTHSLFIADSPLSIPVEISSHSRTEKKQSGEIWYGWCDHFFPHLHCLVSPSFYVTGQISGWSNQSTIRCFHPTEHIRIWGWGFDICKKIIKKIQKVYYWILCSF